MYSKTVLGSVKIIGIFVICLASSHASSKSFEAKSGFLELCHPYTQQGTVVHFQAPLLTENDYKNALKKSTAKNDLEGVSVDFNRSKKFDDMDDLFIYVNQQTFTNGRDVKVSASEFGTQSDLIFRLCIIYENKDGERVYAHNWGKWIVGRIAYNAARVHRGSKHVRTNTTFRNSIVTERIRKPDGKDGRVLVTYEAGKPGELISRTYTIAGAIKDLKKALSKSDIEIEINYQPEISVKDVGIHRYYSPKPGIDPYESNILIDQSDLVEVTTRSIATKETKDMWKFLGDAIWKGKRLGQTGYIFTNSRLSLNFIESKLFGD